MGTPLQIEDVFIQVRDKLQKDGVKLWLPPYYNEATGASESDLQVLAHEFSDQLNIPQNSCYAAISELQTSALEKLKQRNQFKESGLATLKVKFLSTHAPPKLITIEVMLSYNGLHLKQLISERVNVAADQLKLIANGIVVKDAAILGQQGISNGFLVLAVKLAESVTSIHQSEDRFRDLEMTKADTSLLASSDDGQYMQLEDQQGNAINIPVHEKKALMVAMALHEKGRTALKRDDFAKALVFFLDADKEFSQCNAALLKSVDNYALLDLDIAWCYLCLQSFQHLPEAQIRLKRCEDMFHNSYGPNLERLIALKGSIGNERALFMRLHLLQSIVMFHQNKRDEALSLLKQAQIELHNLKVEPESMSTLIELGFSPAEARLGLRTHHGDLNLAANYINENRLKRSEARKKALAEEILQRERKKLGLCTDGKHYVDPNFVKMLVNMGYSKTSAITALKETNNILSDSIQYIQEHPDPGPSCSRSQEFKGLIEELIPELEAAGFDYRYAKLALQQFNGDIMKAAEALLANSGIIEGDLDNVSEDSNIVKQKLEEKKKQKDDALYRLSQDISMVDDDHLDLTLEKEEEYLMQYLSLFDKEKK